MVNARARRQSGGTKFTTGLRSALSASSSLSSTDFSWQYHSTLINLNLSCGSLAEAFLSRKGGIAGREIKKASYREVNRLIEKKNTIFKVHMMCFMHYIFYFLHALHLIFITNYQILFHFKDKKNKANTN